jgi:hypothetical protein
VPPDIISLAFLASDEESISEVKEQIKHILLPTMTGDHEKSVQQMGPTA